MSKKTRLVLSATTSTLCFAWWLAVTGYQNPWLVWVLGLATVAFGIYAIVVWWQWSTEGHAEGWMPIDAAQEWLRSLFKQHGLTDEAKLASAPMATIQMAIGTGRLKFKGASTAEITHVNRAELLNDYPDKEHSMLYDSFAGTYLYPTPGTPQAIVMYSAKRTLFKDSPITGGVHLDKTEDTTFDRSPIKKE